MASRFGNIWYLRSNGPDGAYGGKIDEIFFDTAYGNRLYGYGGNDTFFMRGGFDIVDGGAGNDTFLFQGRNQGGSVRGGSGADHFFIDDNFSGRLSIMDFNSREGDKLTFEKDVVRWGVEYRSEASATGYGMAHYFADGSSVFVLGQDFASLYRDMANGAVVDV